jgi:holo-[acyl-carrier protein] synthase
MIAGTGIDVIEIDRIEQAMVRHGEAFLDRLFTPIERGYCDGKAKPAASYAARFAAKEAAAKALGTGIGATAGWRDFEIVNGESGAPELRITGAAAATMRTRGVSFILISLTHARDYAAAHAIAVREDKPSLL